MNDTVFTLASLKTLLPAAALFLLLIAVNIFFTVQKKKKIEAAIKREQKENKRLERQVNDRIASFNRTAQDAVTEAAELYDEVTPDLIESLVDDVQEELDKAETYSEALTVMESGMLKLEHLTGRMREHARKLRQDKKEQEQARQRYEERHPYVGTVYFKACKDADDVRKTYRRLVKTYHPDAPGGDAEIFIKIQQEYDRITEREKVL